MERKKMIIAKYNDEGASKGMNALEAYISAYEGFSITPKICGGGSRHGFFTFYAFGDIDSKMLIERANKHLEEEGIKSITVIDVCDFQK